MPRTRARFVACLVLSALAVAGCGPRRTVLRVCSPPGRIQPELIQRFENEHHATVLMTSCASGEAMLAGLEAGTTVCDLVLAGGRTVDSMWKKGMLQPLDRAKIPNSRNVDRAYLRFTMDPEMNHSVPCLVTSCGIGRLGSRVPDFETSWGVFDRAAYAGRMALLDDLREVLGAALKHVGFSLNTTDDREIHAARDIVIGWRKNVAKFDSDPDAQALVGGDVVLCHARSADVSRAMERNGDIAYAVPREGTSVASESMAVPANARQADLAHVFINFLHDPEVAAANTRYAHALCPNVASYEHLRGGILENPAIFLPKDILEKSEAILDLGKDNAKYVKVWEEIKAAE